MAGIRYCSGNTCVVIDVDLQDPPELIAPLYAKLHEGFDVVYAKRRSRRGETVLKRLISYLGYKLINSVTDVAIPRDTGDFRIMSRRIVEHLGTLKESHGFLRGLVAFVGFPHSFIEYDRDVRAFGKGNYNRYLGSLTIGFNGLIGFSNFLLNAMLLAGLAITVGCFVLAAGIVVSRFVFEVDYPVGTPTIIISILFMGGVQLISVGVLGQYVGRVYDEVKGRPPFIVDRAVNLSAPAPGDRQTPMSIIRRHREGSPRSRFCSSCSSGCVTIILPWVPSSPELSIARESASSMSAAQRPPARGKSSI